MNDESYLRQTVRSAILDGDLPGRLPDAPGGRPATGAECAVCRRPTTDGEHKLTYGEGHVVRTWFMHPACYRLFQAELQALEQARTTLPGSRASQPTGERS